MNKVQEVLKAAIARLEKSNLELDGIGNYTCQMYNQEAIIQCKSALSDIEKCEPVGETVETLEHWLSINMPAGTVIGDPLWWARKIRNVIAYTSPISKEWLSLTYDQKMDLKENNDWYNFPNDLIEATEAKLKQLNAAEKG